MVNFIRPYGLVIYPTTTFVLIQSIEVEYLHSQSYLLLRVKYDLSVVLGVLSKGDKVLVSRRKRCDKLGGSGNSLGAKKSLEKQILIH